MAAVLVQLLEMHGIDPQIVIVPGDGSAIIRDPDLPKEIEIEPGKDVAAGGDPAGKIDILAPPAPPLDTQRGGLSRSDAFDAGRLAHTVLLCDRKAGIDPVFGNTASRHAIYP
jgi:hypothetical protein